MVSYVVYDTEPPAPPAPPAASSCASLKRQEEEEDLEELFIELEAAEQLHANYKKKLTMRQALYDAKMRRAGVDLIPGSASRRPPGSEGRKERIT